ncbi:MAG: ATP-binding cassette domain-containing protein [Lachnospiraceae bacterium]
MQIEASNLSKKLDHFLLSDISFTLPEGYICGLVGKNGSGKTSLLHLLAGLYRQDEGELQIGEMSYEKNSRKILNHIGIVLQEALFEEKDSLEENGKIYGSFYQEFKWERFREYLNRFKLMEKRRYGCLSKGERLKFQFAFALSHGARLLLLDEPTGNFDPEFQEEFFRLLKEFIADGKNSVILATHATGDLDRLADYILYLKEGRLRLFSDTESLRDNYRMIQGEGYKIRLIRQERILYEEEGSFGRRALVKAGKNSSFDPQLQVWRPTLEELMYGLEKGKEKR